LRIQFADIAPPPETAMLRSMIALFLLGLLAGCSTQKPKSAMLDNTLRAYESTIRWNNFEEASGAIDPDVLKEHPVTDQQLQQFKSVHVSGYTAQPVHPLGQDEVGQTVSIDLIDDRTQTLRTITDRQRWRYDAKAKRWWLMTGLPDVSKH
jgi:hypothetical protein